MQLFSIHGADEQVAFDATGRARAVVIHCASLRGAPDDLLAELGV